MVPRELFDHMTARFGETEVVELTAVDRHLQHGGAIVLVALQVEIEATSAERTRPA